LLSGEGIGRFERVTAHQMGGIGVQMRPLGQSGIQASAIGLGTWAVGGWMWGGSEEAECIRAIQASLDTGVNLVDTAPMYGYGRSEEIVGKAIRSRRDRVVLATKCGMVWWGTQGTHFFDKDETAIYRYLGPESICHEVEQSLKRLGVDHIDLYQTHWQDDTTPREDTMATLLDLKAQGKIRAIGVSNIQVSQLKEYQALGAVDSAQEQFSMLDRQIEGELLPHCRSTNVAMLAYSPLALGLLSGRIGPDRKFEGDDLRRGNPRFSAENLTKVAAMLEEMRPVADSRSLTLAQLVIAWTIAQPGLTHALVGARRPEHAAENAVPGDVVLSDDELAVINGAIERHRPGLA